MEVKWRRSLGVCSIILAILLISCSEKTEKKDTLKFLSMDDTTSVFKYTEVDSSLFEAYKVYLETNGSSLINLEYTISQLDSTFQEVVNRAETFNEIQKNISVEINNIFSDKDPLELFPKEELRVVIHNTSGKYIDALELELKFFNPYKEYVGSRKIEVKSIIAPNSYLEKELGQQTGYSSFSYDYQSYYIITFLKKIALSEDTSLSSKIDGEIYDYSDYDFPSYLGLGHDGEGHIVKF